MQPVVLNLAQNSFAANTVCTKQRERPHITSSDRGEGFVARFTSAPTPYEGQNYTFRQNYTTMKTYL